LLTLIFAVLRADAATFVATLLIRYAATLMRRRYATLTTTLIFLPFTRHVLLRGHTLTSCVVTSSHARPFTFSLHAITRYAYDYYMIRHAAAGTLMSPLMLPCRCRCHAATPYTPLLLTLLALQHAAMSAATC